MVVWQGKSKARGNCACTLRHPNRMKWLGAYTIDLPTRIRLRSPQELRTSTPKPKRQLTNQISTITDEIEEKRLRKLST